MEREPGYPHGYYQSSRVSGKYYYLFELKGFFYRGNRRSFLAGKSTVQNNNLSLLVESISIHNDN